jgi:hypothetical protein
MSSCGHPFAGGISRRSKASDFLMIVEMIFITQKSRDVTPCAPFHRRDELSFTVIARVFAKKLQ